MSRRRLMLASYSDDDVEELDARQRHNQAQPQPQPDTEPDPANRSPNPNPIIPDPVPIIGDEDDEVDFVDVSEDISPPPPAPEPQSSSFLTNRPPVPVQESSSGCPIGDFLSGLGIRLKREWLESCLQGMPPNLDVPSKAKLCFQQFLVSDMNLCGAGVLPPNVDSLHLVDLPGPFVLQVDEIVNMSCPLKGRYKDDPSGVKRCLKLSLTDGVHRVFGMEYRPIKDLKALAPAGLKVAIRNVHIRHGLLMLVPEALEVLGGIVEEFDAARQRLVDEVNKPPRGKRSRTGVVPPLATRATLAAWPSNGGNIPGNANNSVSIVGHTNNSANFPGRTNGSVNVLGPTSNSALFGGHNWSTSANASTFQENQQGSNLFTPITGANQRNTEEFSVPVDAEHAASNQASAVISGVGEMHIDAPPPIRANAMSNQDTNATSDHEDDVQMVDEHPSVSCEDLEIPFTYLSTLSVKWAAMKFKAPFVQGKVKCFLTGVKGFQYKQRTTYELRVYIDDGSLISEILIDHNVVRKGIGYSPQEVTAALSSSDTKRVSDMKETLKQFQIFLVNFEGIMLLEINGSSPLPVALEMNQGCPASDALLLMRRLNCFAPAETPERRPATHPIEISP